MAKNVYVIAGPNGSGKTTFAIMFLPDYVKCPNFVNADLSAASITFLTCMNRCLIPGRSLVVWQNGKTVRISPYTVR